MNDGYTKRILDSIAEALNSGRSDITIFVISLSAVIILSVMLPMIISSANRRKIKKSAFLSYQKLIRKFNLTILEADLLEELSKALLHPEKKYLLLKNRGTFRYAVQRMEGTVKENREILESLSGKLGFSAAARLENVFSTKLFKPGTPVKIKTGKGLILDAEIYSVSNFGIIIKYIDVDYKISEGEDLRLIACAFDGFKIYNIKAQKVKAALFSSRHADPEKIVKEVIRFRVIVENERDTHSETRKTKVVVMAERGAGLLNTPNKLRPGDDLRIFFDNDKKRISHVNAEVIKTSGLSRLVTLRYSHIKKHNK